MKIQYEEAIEDINDLWNIDQPNIAYHIVQDALQVTYGYSIPGTEAVTEIVNLSPIIEMGAGLGYWAKYIKIAGGKIKCLDTNPPPKRMQHHPINQCSEDHIPDKDHTLLMIWPLSHFHNSTMSEDILSRYEGNTLIYIGESWGGCTGSEQFFKMLKEGWYIEKTIGIPNHNFIYDSCYIYRRFTN